jgi:four helix bundle protein
MSDKFSTAESATLTKPRSYRDLLVWQKGIEPAKAVYHVTKQFPVDERFGLISQIRRSAVSIPSNIAEGQARRTTGEFLQFISYAEGSIAEIDTQLFLAVELGLVTADQVADCFNLIGDLRRMLNGLRRKLDTTG